MSREKIISPYKSDTNCSPEYHSSYGIVTFKGTCLKQKSVSFLHKKVVNLYISYTLDKWSKDLPTDFMLGNCLFGAVKLTKNSFTANLEKCVGSCNTLNDITNKVCVPNKTEDLNLNVFNMITGIN